MHEGNGQDLVPDPQSGMPRRNVAALMVAPAGGPVKPLPRPENEAVIALRCPATGPWRATSGTLASVLPGAADLVLAFRKHSGPSPGKRIGHRDGFGGRSSCWGCRARPYGVGRSLRG